MVVSRRGFIKRGSLIVLASAVSLGSADSIFGRTSEFENSGPTEGDLQSTNDNPAPFNYSKATFVPHVNTLFRIHVNSSKVLETTLISIADIGPVPDTAEAGRECFVLTFRGAETLRQNTYRIEHQTLGQFELFLVPAGKNKKGVYCQAVINRLNG